MSSGTRSFTLDEARSLLKDLLPDLAEVVRLKRVLDARRYDIYRHQYFGGAGPNGTGSYPRELESLVKLLRKFDEEGVLVKSLDEGLIDFPHVRENGEEIFLCYKLGEENILFWHPMETGFAARRKTSEL